jgi:hypothetical protein
MNIHCIIGRWSFYLHAGDVYRVATDNAGPIDLNTGMPSNVRWECTEHAWPQCQQQYQAILSHNTCSTHDNA